MMPMEDYLQFIGAKIRMVRGGQTRHLFCRRYDISLSSLIRWEKGERAADIFFLRDLVLRNNITFTWLLQSAQETQENATASTGVPLSRYAIFRAELKAMSEQLTFIYAQNRMLQHANAVLEQKIHQLEKRIKMRK